METMGQGSGLSLLPLCPAFPGLSLSAIFPESSPANFLALFSFLFLTPFSGTDLDLHGPQEMQILPSLWGSESQAVPGPAGSP